MTKALSLLEREIQNAMGDVRGARVHPESAEAVDGALAALSERAETVGTDEPLTRALQSAEGAFRAGDTAETIQHLSRALLRVTRLQTGSNQA